MILDGAFLTCDSEHGHWYSLPNKTRWEAIKECIIENDLTPGDVIKIGQGVSVDPSVETHHVEDVLESITENQFDFIEDVDIKLDKEVLKQVAARWEFDLMAALVKTDQVLDPTHFGNRKRIVPNQILFNSVAHLDRIV